MISSLTHIRERPHAANREPIIGWAGSGSTLKSTALGATENNTRTATAPRTSTVLCTQKALASIFHQHDRHGGRQKIRCTSAPRARNTPKHTTPPRGPYPPPLCATARRRRGPIAYTQREGVRLADRGVRVTPGNKILPPSSRQSTGAAPRPAVRVLPVRITPLSIGGPSTGCPRSRWE